jgi:para-aminobenzoate synthetase component 1
MLNRKQAIQQMNVWGSTGQPFYFIISFDASVTVLSSSSSQDGLHFNFHSNDHSSLNPKELQLDKQTPSFDSFKKQFEEVVSNIRYGNSFLVNLTNQTPITSNLDLREIYLHSRAKYKVLWDDRFVCFSPETFVTITDNIISSHPMKGTIDASLPEAASAILNDPKETAEHITIVDLIRNDLSMVASEVSVSNFRYIDEIKTHEKRLLQVSTEITGKMDDQWQRELGTILFKLLPAGSISGAPKSQTVEIIDKAENYQRGFYTGICGYFDGENLDTGVMIRFIEKNGDSLYFKSGGGITASSDVKAEYQEMIDKIYVPVY